MKLKTEQDAKVVLLADHLVKMKNRELIICLTALVSLISLSVVGTLKLHYYPHYTSGFLLSFLLFLLCFTSIHLTDSYRIIGLMIFITVNMSADLLNIISTDFYYMLEYYRYDAIYNFADLFTTYEVVCVLFSVSNWAINKYRKRFRHYSHGRNARLHRSHVNKISHYR